jgi:hypothetical protein
MSKGDTHQHLSLSIDLAEQALAIEVASETDISIDIRAPFWSGPDGAEDGVPDKIGVFCESEERAALFKRAFGVRRWEDSKNPQGE